MTCLPSAVSILFILVWAVSCGPEALPSTSTLSTSNLEATADAQSVPKPAGVPTPVATSGNSRGPIWSQTIFHLTPLN